MPHDPHQHAPTHAVLDAWAEREIQHAQTLAAQSGGATLTLQPSDAMLHAVRASGRAHSRKLAIAYSLAGAVVLIVLLLLLTSSGVADMFADMIAPKASKLDRFEPLEP